MDLVYMEILAFPTTSNFNVTFQSFHMLNKNLNYHMSYDCHRNFSAKFVEESYDARGQFSG